MFPITPPPHALHLEPTCWRAIDRLEGLDRTFLVANYGLHGRAPRRVADIANDLGRTRTEVGVGIGHAVRSLHNDPLSRRAFFTLLCTYDDTIPPEPTPCSSWSLVASTLLGRRTAREAWVAGWIGRLPPMATLALAVVPHNPAGWMTSRLALFHQDA